MITLTVIAILATIVVPKYARTTEHAAEANVLTQLSMIRRQIIVYDAQHAENPFKPVTSNSSKPGRKMMTSPWLQLLEAGLLKAQPQNPLQEGASNVDLVPRPGVGWVWSDPFGSGEPNIFAVDEKGGYLDTDGDGVPE